MKTLKFCFALFGLLFCANGNVKAQPKQPQVSIQSISTNGGNTFSITVKSTNIPAKLAISLYYCETCDKSNPGPYPSGIWNTGSLTTEHTFVVHLPIGEQAYLRCGYMDNTGTYKASDGGCIIGIDP